MPPPVGILLGPRVGRDGTFSVSVELEAPEQSSGRIVFGYHAATTTYYSAGLGGYSLAYLVDEYQPNRGWQAVRAAGSASNLAAREATAVSIEVAGQRVSLSVNGVDVLETDLPSPLAGDQVGLFAWGDTPVKFRSFAAVTRRPKAFVVMQFGGPFDVLYEEVIRPVAERCGFEAYRADDMYGPGVILQDIIRSIREADVVVAEITPANPNVFYELGYAHAAGKSTVLLAAKQEGARLPFDVSGYRCIFYEDSIGGKRRVENQFEQHLRNIARGPREVP